MFPDASPVVQRTVLRNDRNLWDAPGVRSRWIPALTFAALMVRSGVPEAHPLGMSSVNRYLGVKLDAREIELDYLLDFAEIPAWTELERLDPDRDGRVTPAERNAWLDRLTPEVARGIRVELDGRELPLRLVFRGVDAPPGQNGLSTLRLAIEFRAPLPDTDEVTVRVRDVGYANRPGWREIAAEPTVHARLRRSSLDQGRPRAGAALAYPTQDLARAPRDDEATFVFARGTHDGAVDAALPARVRDRPGSTEGARLVGLLRDPARSPGFVLFALALAFALGAGHALAPGHGKALVGAWLLGTRGRARDALVLGAVLTVTHTATVFALGGLALGLERYVGSDKVLRALELMSGAMVMGVALGQLPGRWRALRRGEPSAEERAHAEAHRPREITFRALVAMGVSGGIVPCPGALVVLLAAISMRRVGFGLALLVAFSLGLATVLSGVGLVFVLARRWFERMPGEGRTLRVLALVSSCAVLVLGAAIVVKALVP